MLMPTFLSETSTVAPETAATSEAAASAASVAASLAASVAASVAAAVVSAGLLPQPAIDITIIDATAIAAAFLTNLML